MTRLLLLATCAFSALSSVDAALGVGDGSSAVANGGAPSSSEQCSGASCNQVGANAAKPPAGGAAMPAGMPAEMVMPSSGSSMTMVKMGMGGNAPVQDLAKPAMPAGKTWSVDVGGAAGLVYTPPTIKAAVGDMVTFNFLKMNHSLTQSTFDKPCVKMAGGMDSGFMPNPDGKVPPPMIMMQVMDTKPQWFYCRQKVPVGHCGKGMGFSINPTADKSQEKFIAMAKEQNGTMDMGSMSMGSSMGSSMGMDSTTAAGASTAASGSMTMTMTDSSMMMMGSTTAAAAAGAGGSMTSVSIAPISQIGDGQIQAPTGVPGAPAGSPPPPPPAAAAPAPAAAPPAPPAAAAPPPPPPASPPAAAAPPPAPPAAAALPPQMAQGSGAGGGETCSCTCMCGVGAFPQANQGMGMYGGMSGAVPQVAGGSSSGGGHKFMA